MVTLVDCPFCDGSTETRVVYGFPNALDFPESCIYGGEEPPASAATHFCEECQKTWHAPNYRIIFFPFPETCDFCDSLLSPSDKFAFNMEFQEWLSPTDFRLAGSTFTSSVFPSCSDCRTSIDQNTDEMQEEELQVEQTRAFVNRTILFGAMMFVSLLVIAWLLS